MAGQRPGHLLPTTWRICLMPETPTFGRYAEIPYDRMTPEQQEGYRAMMEARGRLPGPNKIYVHNPKLAKVMGPLGAYFRTGYSLSKREREIAVVIINSKWHSIYPTNAHERAAEMTLASTTCRPGLLARRAEQPGLRRRAKPRSRPVDKHRTAAGGDPKA